MPIGLIGISLLADLPTELLTDPDEGAVDVACSLSHARLMAEAAALKIRAKELRNLEGGDGRISRIRGLQTPEDKHQGCDCPRTTRHHRIR